MEEVQSVRGKGWVKFDDEDGVQTSQSNSPDNNQTPGSLEVGLYILHLGYRVYRDTCEKS